MFEIAGCHQANGAGGAFGSHTSSGVLQYTNTVTLKKIFPKKFAVRSVAA
jgi:hypothetical protein